METINTEDQIISHAISGIEGIQADSTPADDLHNDLFNMDYFIIGYYDANKFLEAYGVFDAISKVKEWEEENFGESNTDLSCPEKVVNMLAYIKGEELLQGLDSFKELGDGLLSKESIDALKKELEDLL